jgi:hypothetical protein
MSRRFVGTVAIVAAVLLPVPPTLKASPVASSGAREMVKGRLVLSVRSLVAWSAVS